MNLLSCKQQLLELGKVEFTQWQQLETQWQDQKQTEFKKAYISPLDTQMRRTINAIEELDEIFRHFKGDCLS